MIIFMFISVFFFAIDSWRIMPTGHTLGTTPFFSNTFVLSWSSAIDSSIHPSVLPSSVCRLLNIPYFQCGITIRSIVCKLTSSFPQKRALIEQANKGWGGNFDLIQQIEISIWMMTTTMMAKERFQILGNNQRTSKKFLSLDKHLLFSWFQKKGGNGSLRN